MKRMTTTIAFAALLVLPACANDEPLGVDFGNAVESNKAMHIIDPAPVYDAPETPDYDGTRAGAALQRYEDGAVIQPKTLETGDF